jgi:superfamily II DNA/RNA helicase
VIQGYQMLCEHNGFFLADVVGLGKTIVAAMIAKRFVESNGKNTNILVVYPPALENNWKETFKQFGINKKAQFVSNGSLSKILENEDNYKDKKEFDLIIVDEAHGFRSDTTNRYDELQRICKTPRNNSGLMRSLQKKVMLLSATPLNNRPNDLFNLILLFQDARRSTIDGISNLQNFFAPLIDRYKKVMKNRKTLKNTDEVDEIYKEIRDKVLDKITVRRTRRNIMNDEYYKKDLDEQQIKFPEILPPKEIEYKLNNKLSNLFYSTLSVLTDEENGLKYARYRAVEFLTPEQQKKFKNPKNIGENLKGIYRVHLVKRLESSFYAFKKSLTTFTKITEDMLKMFAESKIIVTPELNLKDLQSKGWELDRIIEFAIEKGYDKSDFLFKPEDFDENFLLMLENDRDKLKHLLAEWNNITEDPKLDLFIDKLQSELLATKINPAGKLVVFSESVDTVGYLEEQLKAKLNRADILMVSSANRDREKDIIRQCFDANYEKHSEKYNIVITSDVLAEGVNLHRSNVIVNYDSPWNATRLMQRIGRVNRIGSVADGIYNYMFYPSAEGDAQIQLYNNALIKLQGFHSALGEDAQIYSKEEIVKEFQLFDPKVKDKVDKQLELLREVRELYNTDRELYKKIKKLPLKSRTIRNAKQEENKNTTIAFIQSPIKTEYYRVMAKKVEPIDFIDAALILKAKKNELAADFTAHVAKIHFSQVNRALKKFQEESIAQQDADSLNVQMHDKSAAEAAKFFRLYTNTTTDNEVKQQCFTLQNYIEQGIYNKLQKEVKALAREYKGNQSLMNEKQYEIDKQINALYKTYHTDENSNYEIDNTEPNIVLSETLI